MLFHLSAHPHFFGFFYCLRHLLLEACSVSHRSLACSMLGPRIREKNALKLHVDFGFKELKIFAELRGGKCWAWHKLGYLVLTAVDFQSKLSSAPVISSSLCTFLGETAHAPNSDPACALLFQLFPGGPDPAGASTCCRCPNIIKDECSRKFVCHCFLGSAQCTLSV